jgi:ATPase subunit of ABC transporter with duplicated ATPase domains
MFSCSSLSFAYPNRDPLFRNLSFSFSEHENIQIKGENGCGKSTLLKLLCGKLPASEGKIERQKDAFFYLPQNAESRILGVNLEQDMKIWQISGMDIGPVLDHPLLWGLKDSILSLPLRELSQGAKQAYLLSIALCMPHYLVLDEPFTALDSMRREILDRELAKRQGMLVVSHLSTRFMPQRILSLAEGKLQ